MLKLILLSLTFFLSACSLRPATSSNIQVPTSAEPTEYNLTATQSGTIALDLLASQATIETKDYGDLGLLVVSINGLSADPSHYWGFYLNGEYAQTSASKTILEINDTIQFKYEAIDQSIF